MRRVPGHLLVQPDQQRPALPERIVVGGPVCRAVAGGLKLAHAPRLTAWIPDVNPSPAEFCNNAHLPDARYFRGIRITELPAHRRAAIILKGETFVF